MAGPADGAGGGAGASDPAAAEPAPRRNALSPSFTGLLGLLVGLALGAALFTADAQSGSELTAAEDVPRSSLGAEDAPVTLTIYSDFACPYCAEHDQTVEPALVEEYVDSGQVRFVWQDVPLQGSGAFDLAVAGRAAELQGGFWAFKDAVFAAGDGDGSRGALRRAAEVADLDLDRFEADLDDPALELAVRRDREAARELGVQGTPAFLVADQPLIGLQPLDALTSAIDEALAAERA